jgi:hypothetical protein
MYFWVLKIRFSLISSSARKWFRFFNTSVLIDLGYIMASLCFLIPVWYRTYGYIMASLCFLLTYRLKPDRVLSFLKADLFLFRLADGKRVLVEGANAGMLDIDFGKDEKARWDRAWTSIRRTLEGVELQTEQVTYLT